MDTFLNWTSNHKKCLILIYLTVRNLIPKRHTLNFIFMQQTSNRVYAVLQALKNNTDYVKLSEALTSPESKISRNCGYYFSSSKNKYRTLIHPGTVPLLLQLLNDALCVKVFIKITETIACQILNYSSKSKKNRFLNRQRHKFQRALKRYPVSEPLDIKLCAAATKYFKTVKFRILNDTISQNKLTWLIDVNKSKIRPYLFC